MDLISRLESLFDEKKHKQLCALCEANRHEVENCLFYIIFSRSLFALGRYEEGSAIIEEAISLFPGSLDVRIRHAECSMAKGQWSDAVVRWTYITDNFERYSKGVFLRQATAYLNLKEFDKAREGALKVPEHSGSGLKAKNLISLIESEKAKKYEILIRDLYEAKDRCLVINLEQGRIGKLSFFKSYKITGKVRRKSSESVYLLVRKKSGIDEYDLNNIRTNKASDLKSSGIAAYSEYEFGLELNLTEAEAIGALVDGVVSWSHSVEFKSVIGVMEGKEGWLFLQNDTNHSIDVFTGSRKLTQSSFYDWSLFAEKLINLQKERDLIYFIANAKENVFPEFHLYQRGEITIVDEVRTILDSAGVRYLNPERIMAEEPSSFYKTDSHWSDLGGYLGFVQCLNVLGYENHLKGNIVFSEMEVVGDLGSKLSPSMKSNKMVHNYNGRCVPGHVFSNDVAGMGAINVFSNSQSFFDKSVLIFGDSYMFSGQFAKYFHYLFRRLVTINLPGSMVEEIVNFENPDILILQTNDRYLSTPGKVYCDFENSPLLVKISELSKLDKERLLIKMKQSSSECFYRNIIAGTVAV